MEFVTPQEIAGLLAEFGITAQQKNENAVHLAMADDEGAMRFQLSGSSCPHPVDDGVIALLRERDQLAAVIDRILHRLHLQEVALIPVGPWRMVFDAVAFRLANNDHWREIDASATVELNKRDPLLCENTEFQTLNSLLEALLEDADRAEQGLALVSLTSPILLEVNPEGLVRVSAGTPALAEEVAEIVRK